MFLKCITRKGTPFPKDFRIDPELSAGSYTLVAWGNLTDEVTLQPAFIAGQTTLEQVLLSLNAAEDRSVNHRLTPVFHAMKQVEVNDVKEHTEVLSLIKNENHLHLNVKWFEKAEYHVFTAVRMACVSVYLIPKGRPINLIIL